MALFGIPDPWIWMSYIACGACIVFCVVWGLLKKDVDEDGE